MKIYTRSGDDGITSLVYGDRVPKSDIRVSAYGTCDEANSLVGLAWSYLSTLDFHDKVFIEETIHQIQTKLFYVGSELATPEGKVVAWKLYEEDVLLLEKWIDRLDGKLPVLQQFILPGGHPAGATLHVARTVIRRAERLSVEVPNSNPLVLKYLNRLSDYLFVLARYINKEINRVEKGLHQS